MKILFITATRIGDAVLSTGLLAHLLEQHPDARITIACGAPAAPLFEAVPNLDRVIVVRKKPYHGHWLSLWSQCVRRYWDIVVDLRGSGLAWMLPAGRRHVMRKRDDTLHRVELLASLLNLDPPPVPRLWVSDSAREEVDGLIPPALPILSIAPGANWGPKQWPADRFADLVRRLTRAAGPLSGGAVAIHGAEDERGHVAPILDVVRPERVIDLLGAPLPVAYACFARSDFYVGNDSGLTHLAAASGTPTLALFGPTNELHYAPWGLHTATVRTAESLEDLVGSPDFDHRSNAPLMDGLSVDAAEAAAVALWERCAKMDA